MHKLLVSMGLVALALVPLATLAAQEPEQPLEPGARVRVTAPNLGMDKEVATFEAFQGDTLVVTADSTMHCPFTFLTRLDVYQGQKSNLLLSMGIGFVAGAGLGALVGASMDCEKAGFSDEASCTGLGAAGGAAVGLLVGTTAGLLIKSDRWEEVPLDQLRVSVVPQRGGFRLGLSVAF
jgi:hypothetical protein